MNEPKPISLIWLIIAALIAVIIVFDTVYGDDDHECRGHSCNDSTDVIDASSVVNNSVSDSSNGYGIGFGDANIAECYRSYQILIWQDSKINPLCLADSYDAKGLHDMAAIIRCDIRAIRKHFSSNVKCIEMNTMGFDVPHNTNYNSANEKLILQMWESSSLWTEDLPDLSRSLYETLEKAGSADIGTKEKGQLSELRGRLSEAGKIGEEALREMWVSELTDASPGLLKTIRRNLVLPQMSSISSQNDDDEDDRIDLLYARLNDLQAQRTADIANADKAAQRANAAAVRAEIDRKEYAQQMLEELNEWK